DVVNVDDVTRDAHIERELLLIKLKHSSSQADALRKALSQAGATILSDDPNSFVIELTDSEARISHFISTIGNYGELLEVVRSGALAVLRGMETLRN
ncbi:MAG: acetolactate synthase small subunit, partial [Steroidobacteraceae bacterium]